MNTFGKAPEKAPDTVPLLRAGDTCWRVERAAHLAVIVDAADYFATFRVAAQQARHSILLIGWDFDTRIRLDPRTGDDAVPDRLGKFLNWLVAQHPDLRVHVLKWDLGFLHSLGRGSTPLLMLDWMTSRRIRFKLDHHHPRGSVHHQKVVVIDDALAFCGGIDMTADRWDTRAHRDDDPHRVRPSRRPYGPWHDITTAVDGDAAAALGHLARERWRRATGESLPVPPPVPTHWPHGLVPSMRNVDLGISRTDPPQDGRDGIYEIEALYLAAIAAAKQSLYIESQYFASRKIAEAMAARLRDPDGPEIVVINPETADGWLEEKIMGASRAVVLRIIRDADQHGRFRIYTPVTQGGAPIYVHAKVLVMDDRLLRVGSSNLNNRSLGYDTECDLSVEAVPGMPGEAALRAQIAGLRTDLLAEHLGVENAAVDAAIAGANGSLTGAIETLRGDGRSLRPFEAPELGPLEEEMLAESPILDPERPSRRWRRGRERFGG